MHYFEILSTDVHEEPYLLRFNFCFTLNTLNIYDIWFVEKSYFYRIERIIYLSDYCLILKIV